MTTSPQRSAARNEGDPSPEGADAARWSALVVDDDPGVRQSVRLCLEADGGRVLGVGSTRGAIEALDRGRFDVVLLDLWLGRDNGLTAIPQMLAARPGLGIIVITAYASFETAVEAMRLGAVDYLPKPFTPEQVRLATRRVVEAERLRRRVAELEERVEAEGEDFGETRSPTYRAFLASVQRAAASDSVVILRGESGTGKSVLARQIAANSRRADRPFVAVQCSTLAGEALCGALFGQGTTPGKVEEAAGGTLFLDKISDLTLDAQARLLRLLTNHTYERLGDATERSADVRVIASTTHALEDDVKAGRFREDLLFRLDVVSLKVPPLRERAEDLSALAAHYLQLFRRRQGRPTLELSAAAEDAVRREKWPGNLRQLRNAIERAVILAPGPQLEPEDLGIVVDGKPSRTPVLGGDVTIEELEIEHIARVIARAPSLEAAARILGIDPTTLQRKRKRHGLT
ncbi:MAG: sigma-54-dependent Fis family transcriptional regulator [Deltaproteobacteria bacterium]|nr:sigma-54-dependent Fis family transcriptional regulator [Deltaproteobacteria bacterium]MCW5806240.1 sigma-54-dependent Fis family transcriptional regulator [Deltaproteobacteria bacterium]